MDCDGVLTDGRLYYSGGGEETKVFHVRDGQGIVEWHRAGFRSGIISGRDSPIVKLRAKELGIEFVFLGHDDKVSALNEILAATGLQADEVAFMGDDRPDANMMPFVGLAAAPRDAHPSALNAAHYIAKHSGGRGAVREVIDFLLDSKERESHADE